MPTKEEVKNFIRKHPEIKVKLSQKVGKLNKQTDEAVDRLLKHSPIRHEWSTLKAEAPPKPSPSFLTHMEKIQPVEKATKKTSYHPGSPGWNIQFQLGEIDETGHFPQEPELTQAEITAANAAQHKAFIEKRDAKRKKEKEEKEAKKAKAKKEAAMQAAHLQQLPLTFAMKHGAGWTKKY
jgi:hypothetical protein